MERAELEKLERLSVAAVLERAAATVPDKVAVVDGGRRITFRELDAMADALASGFAGLGFAKGDRVAIYMPNSLELMAAFYALQKLGVVVVWLNPLYRRQEAGFILANSGARGVIIFREWKGYDFLQAVTDLKAETGAPETVVVAGGESGPGVYPLEALLETGRGRSCSRPVIDSRRDLAMLLYTSGTTGRPKGAMITQHAAVRAGWEYSLGVNAGAEDIFIGFLPMSHSYGCGAILIQPLLLHSRVVLMDAFETERAFQIIQDEGVTLQLGAPAHYILELNHPRRSQYDLSTLRAGLIAGQIAPQGLIRRVQDEMGLYISSFWGASEVGPGLGILCPYPAPLETRERFIGKPVAGTEARVVDPLTRRELPDGEIGELTLKGWHVMRGYWENPEETRRQVVDGWLFMGDLVSRGEGGYLRIHGRTKDLINRGGYKIYPHELESVIGNHPKVDQVCVTATPNPVLGESICACVIPKAGSRITLEELRAFLAGKIAPHKLPDELAVMSDFPRLSGGVKINKFGPGGVTELARRDAGRERHRL